VVAGDSPAAFDLAFIARAHSPIPHLNPSSQSTNI
jgi:hypothetical protein